MLSLGSPNRSSFRKAPEFLCHVKFKNSIPEPALDSRVAQAPLDLQRLATYSGGRLEKGYRHQVPFDVLADGMLDCVDLALYEGGASMIKANSSERKGETKPVRPSSSTNSSKQEVTWLRRTEYLASQSNKPRAMNSASKDVGQVPLDSKLASVSDVLASIEGSFINDSSSLVHPTKGASVVPVAVYPVLPSSMLSQFSQVTFDADPMENIANVDGVEVAKNGGDHLMLKTMTSSDDIFVWMYAPTKQGDPDHFVYVRDCDISKVEKSGLNFVISVPKGEAGLAHLTPIAAHFTSKKRRARGGNTSDRNRHTLQVIRR